MDSICIVSGGFDSVTLLHYLVKEKKLNPAVVTFLYGQRHHKEVEFAKAHVKMLQCSIHKIIDLTLLKDVWKYSSLIDSAIPIPEANEISNQIQPSTYVPNRNMIFIALAVAFAETIGVNEIYYGAQKHDLYGYWDTTPEFLTNLNALYSLQVNSPVQIRAPFIKMSKSEILKVGLRLGIDYGQTWSCYQGNQVACGKCPTCTERLKAFSDLGLVDPLTYKKGE